MLSRVRVWLNRTYAENVFFMDQLRRNPSDRAVEIHATHGDPDSPVLAAADTAALEPEGLSPAAYVEYALDQCDAARHRCLRAAAAPVGDRGHRADFEAAGTKLLAPTPEAVAVFQDKAAAYEAVQGIGVPVPPWWRVRTADELLVAVEQLEARGDKACFKPAAGAGGVGFRVITRSPFSMSQLNGFPSPYVPLDLVLDAVRTGRGTGRLAGHAPSGTAGGVGRLPHRPRQPRPDGGGPHQARPQARLHPARAVAGARAADRGGLRAAPPVEHPVPHVRRPAGADGRQHASGGRTAPAVAVRDQRALGGGTVGAR